MSNNDDMLEQFDLSAWEAPPPPADLADRVIDRMGGTDVGIAAVSVEEHRAPRRVWIIAGAAVAAIVLAIGVWSLIRATHQAAPATGGVVADKPRTLSLDTVHATLEPGADVRWRRDGNVLRVEQRAGTVMWHVDADENLVIDAGAASASVQATGANLRVEVQMNAMDARVIGGAALTAAAVAIVTVVVYEGHVKVGKPNQPLVVVAPGSTYKVNAVDDTRPVDDTPTVGGGLAAKQKVAVLGLELLGSVDGDEPVVAHALSASIRATAAKGPYTLAPGSDKELVDVKLLFNCANAHVQCMAAIGADLGADVLVYGYVERAGNTYAVRAKLLDVAAKQIVRSSTALIPVDDAEPDKLDDDARKLYLDLVGVGTHDVATVGDACKSVDEVSCVITNYEGDCCKKYVKQTPATSDGLTRSQISAAIAKVKPQVLACESPSSGKLIVRVQVTPAGTVSNIEITTTPDPALGSCAANILKRAKFAKTKTGGSFSYPFIIAAKAKATCDADALKEDGMQNINMGQHAAALAKFEASLKCKKDAYVVQLAFMEACASANAVKAKQYYKQMSMSSQQKFAQMCKRNNVEYRDVPVGYLQIDSKPAAKILVNGVDTGLTTPIRGQGLELLEGKHKITFVVGGERFTYPIVIKEGETQTMSKDLQ